MTLPNFEDNSDKVVVVPTGPPSRVSARSYDRVTAAAEMHFLKLGRLPSVHELRVKTTLSERTIVKVLSSPEFKERMLKRGIPWTNNLRVQDQLTPEQAAVISVLTDPTLKMDLRAKLKRAGITYSVYRNWLRNPNFSNVIRGIAENNLDAHLPDFHTKVIERGLSGDLNAIKFAYELTGRHDPAKQQMVDFTRMVGLLLEVITRNVTDPAVLRKINDEMDQVLSGKAIDTLEALPANYDVVQSEIVPTVNGVEVPEFLVDSIPINFFDKE